MKQIHEVYEWSTELEEAIKAVHGIDIRKPMNSWEYAWLLGLKNKGQFK